jgi:serine/threonine protein kinase
MILKLNSNDKIDSWSAGITFYKLLTGNFPFNGDNEKKLL